MRENPARIYIYIVYDVSSRESFRDIPRWLEELEKKHAQPDIVKILIGNKVDKVMGTFVPIHVFTVFCAPPPSPLT
jgi:hypothetical protein